jgi:hypothetical protein
MLCDGVGLGKTHVATTVHLAQRQTWRERETEPRNGNGTDRSAMERDAFRITVIVPGAVTTWTREERAPLEAYGVGARAFARQAVVHHPERRGPLRGWCRVLRSRAPDPLRPRAHRRGAQLPERLRAADDGAARPAPPPAPPGSAAARPAPHRHHGRGRRTPLGGYGIGSSDFEPIRAFFSSGEGQPPGPHVSMGFPWEGHGRVHMAADVAVHGEATSRRHTPRPVGCSVGRRTTSVPGSTTAKWNYLQYKHTLNRKTMPGPLFIVQCRCSDFGTPRFLDFPHGFPGSWPTQMVIFCPPATVQLNGRADPNSFITICRNALDK